MDPILIVDDEKDNLEALKRLLRSDYDVTVETSPFEALKLLKEKTFNVIISDQRMPEMSGVELLEKAKKLSPLSTRILLTGYTDIDSVIDAINRGNIYRYIAKPWDPKDLKITLKQANESYQLRVELEEKNRALLKSNDELKKALEGLQLLDRAKARFLSLVSHELNTPLTILSSFVQLLEQTKKSLPPEVQKAIASIANASSRFSDIVSEVLTYVRLESGQKLDLRDFDFHESLSDIVKELEPVFSKKKLRATIQGKGNAVARCDSDKMRLALLKILGDAGDRALPSTEIKVEIDRKNGSLSCAFFRTGEPLPSAAFEPFEPGTQILNHQKNLGMGLALGRAIVESHGGKVTAESAGGLEVLSLIIPAP